MDRRRRGDRKRKGKDRRTGSAQPAKVSAGQLESGALQVNGWTILVHPLFLQQIEKLTAAAEEERHKNAAAPGPSAKLLAHLLELALEKIPQDPANPAYRHGGTLGEDRRQWFRAKTGNGRYRLFYRFQSSARLIVLVWVNDERSLRTYGSRTDAYAVFAGMLDQGNPPDSWDSLIAAARESDTLESWKAVASARRKKR